MPQPIVAKIGKVEIVQKDLAPVAQKAAIAACKAAASGTKFDKKYEITLNVKVELDDKDKPTEVKASTSFVVTEDGKLQPRLAQSKSGTATAKGFGSKVEKGVEQAVDAIVTDSIEKLVEAIKKLVEMEKKGK
jgi:hypothetical protein